MIDNRVVYTLDSTLDSVNQAEAMAGRVAAEAGFQEDEIDAICMAVREATINAILHGNAKDPQKKVGLVFETSPGTLKIAIRDEGKGFDAQNVPDPLAPENLLRQSGRGIFLIRAYMDDVQIRNLQPGTELIMIKHVRGPSPDNKESSSQ
jgi:serine/threonine-protein kinase RsbW